MSAALESLMREPVMVGSPDRQGGGIFTFLLIGGGAALSFVVLSSFMVTLLPMLDAWLVSTACYAVFILPVYLLHRRYTFASDTAHSEALPRYVMVQIMALVLASFFSFVFHDMLALASLPSAVLVVILSSAVNYLVLKGWAFVSTRRPTAVPA